MLVLNKADFLTAEERAQWAQYFRAQGVEMVFFSALAELQRLDLLEEHDADVAHGNLAAAEDVLSCEALFAHLAEFDSSVPEGETLTVGMVGYPNVGEKKVSMSRQPGKTKHFQTIELPQRKLRLCDCPGLVFPSVVATKAHLVIRGVAPIETGCRDTISPVQLIVAKIGVDNVLRFYGCLNHAARFRHENPARILLSAFAVARGHLLKMNEPDLQWAARRVLKDFATGALLHVELPPGMARAQHDDDDAVAAEAAFCAAEGVEDVEDFLASMPENAEATLEAAVGKMNKRQLRQMHKGMMKGKMQVRVDGTS